MTPERSAPPRARRWAPLAITCLGVAVAGLLAFAVLLAMVAPLLLEPWLEQQVRAAARERGFELEFASLHGTWQAVELEGATVHLIGVHGVEAHLDRVTVRLARLAPVGASVAGAQVEITGGAPALALEVAEWARAYPATLAVPFGAREAAVRWRESPGAPPWLDLGEGALVPAGPGGAFAAEKARVAGVDVGRVVAGYAATQAQVELGFGAASPAAAPVRIVVQLAASPPVALITLRPTPLERLAAPLGVALPVAGVTASGEAQLALPASLGPGPVTGTLHVDLVGYIPPHPVELSGFVFGNTTKLETKLAVSEDRAKITLTDTRVTAGRFVVRGQGDVTRSTESARVRLALRGELPCGALADAAAQTRLGEAMGRLAGRLAREVLTGSVAVLLRIDADTRDLSKARLVRTIGVGCGLVPLPIPGLGTLDLGDLELPELIPGVPTALPSALPPVPSGWALPPIPTRLPFPSLGSTSRAREAASAEPSP